MIGLAMMLSAATLPHTFVNGGQLYALCTGDEAAQRNCTAYLIGAVDAAQTLHVPICLPMGTKGQNLRVVATAYLLTQKVEWASGGADMAITAFRKAYPCASS